jgi:hypothetical protein
MADELTDDQLRKWRAAGTVAAGIIAELRAARAELAVLRPSLRQAKRRIDRTLALCDRMDNPAPGTAVFDVAPVLSTRTVRAALTEPKERPMAEPAVTHLALIQASLPPGLTDVAGGTEQHCRAQLEHWVAERGLRDGERALIVAVVAETVAEPGVGIYTVPVEQP